MDRQAPSRFPPGTSVLGGAACGLSYEGARSDAVAREERARRLEAGRQRPLPSPRTQAPRREPAFAGEAAGQ